MAPSRAMNPHMHPVEYPTPCLPESRIERVLERQSALITGASSGIGARIAVAMAQAGADLVINYHEDKLGAQEVAEEASAYGGRVVLCQADVSSESEVVGMFKRATKELGTLDVLVNNAGLQQDAPFDAMTLEQWDRVISVNLTGQFLCAREAVREFKRRGVRRDVSCAAGKIICVSSVHEFIPWAGHVNYAASKGGVMLLMKSLAQEVAPYRIRVNSIAPGAIRTPINKEAWETKEAYQKLMHLVPYNRIGEPDDIGRAAVWLASDQSDYVVGTTLVVDGGMALYPAFADGG